MRQPAPNRRFLSRAAAFALAATLLTPLCQFPARCAAAKVWQGDAKLVQSLQPEVIFEQYLIRLPEGFIESRAESYKDGSRTEWHGPARADGSHPAISVWIVRLTREQAAGDPVALGEKMLEQSGRSGAIKYERTKAETGLAGRQFWATRFNNTATVKATATNSVVDLRAVNYVWQDRGRLILASAYDTQKHAGNTLPELEASICTIHAAPGTEIDQRGLSIKVTH